MEEETGSVTASSVPPSPARSAQLNDKQLKAYLKRAVERRKELELEVQHLKNEIEAKDLRLQTLEPIINTSLEEKELVSKELSEQKNRVKILENQLSDSLEEVRQSKELIQNLQNTLASSNAEDQINDLISGFDEEKSNYEKKILDLEQNIFTIQKELKEQIQINKKLENEFQNHNFQQDDSQNLQNKIFELENEIDFLKNKNERENNSFNESENEIHQLKNQIHQKELNLSQQASKIQELQNNILQMKKENEQNTKNYENEIAFLKNSKQSETNEQIHQLKMQVVSYQKQIQEMNEQLNKNQEIYNQNLERMKAEQASIQNHTQIHKQLTEQTESLKIEISKKNDEINQLNVQNKNLLESQKENEAKLLISSKTKLTKLAAKIIELKKELESRDNELKQVQRFIQNTFSEKMMKFEFQMSDFQNQINEKDDKINQLKDNLVAVQKTRSSAQSSLEDIEKLQEDIKKQLDLSEQRCANLQTLNDQLHESEGKLQMRVNELSENLQNKENENLELTNKLNDLDNDLQNHKTQGGKLKKFLKSIQSENDRLNETIKEKNELVHQKELEINLKNEEIKKLSEVGTKNESERMAIIEKSRRYEEDKMLAESEKQQVIAKSAKIQVQLTEMRKKYQECEFALQTEKMKNGELNESINKMQNEMREMDFALINAETEVRANAAELEELREKCQNHSSQILEIQKEKKDALRKLKQIELNRKAIVLSLKTDDHIIDLPLIETIKIPKTEEINDKKVSAAYIQKLMMQFFSQDNQQREILVPVILELIGCDKLQIQQAQNAWKNSTQRRGFGWF
ncbi:hypothetical protein TRFO_36366 [Tritrichomonas foetus]|uniref:GRIP domain-containing protein n=1 Tax=Tritrichomonas foetus TaxID=1144522 RepID=A0A1J4JIN4_9EUKA|nr:hypothetical protein TRFO_36366 [Tritrichomonas foetus]|eukprot:OHS97411.1 hypothetical protein TRFO_36366 [Tritrichomonas foetus]